MRKLNLKTDKTFNSTLKNLTHLEVQLENLNNNRELGEWTREKAMFETKQRIDALRRVLIEDVKAFLNEAS